MKVIGAMVKNDIYKRYNVKKQSIILNHIQNNIKEYLIASIIFIIGILLGIVVVNNLNEMQADNIHTYITDVVSQLKNNKNLNKRQLFIDDIKRDVIAVTLMWILGSTVIGLLLVYIIVAFKRL